MNAKRLEVATLGGGCFWCLVTVWSELRQGHSYSIWL